MNPKTLPRTIFLGALLLGALLGTITMRLIPAAQAAPPGRPSPVVPSNPMAGLLAGKTFPTTIKTDDIDSAYSLIGLVDGQGKPGKYVTKGDTFTVGGETFLVAYDISQVVDSAKGIVLTGKTAPLILLNFHTIQAMGGFAPVPTGDGKS